MAFPLAPLGGSGAEWGAPPLVCLAWYGVGIGSGTKCLLGATKGVIGGNLISPDTLGCDNPHYYGRRGCGDTADCGILYHLPLPLRNTSLAGGWE